jgi:uncharacterized protein involved in exopolysaccharide biosynthesis
MKKNAAECDINLLDCLTVLVKYSRMVIYATAAVTILTFLILSLHPNKYQAVASLLPPQQNLTLSAQLLDNLGGLLTPGSRAAGELGGWASLLGGSPGDLYVGMLRGSTVSDYIIKRFNLRDHYKIAYIEGLRKALNSRVRINAAKEGIISIEVTDEDPKKAAAMANAYMEELDKLLQDMALQEVRGRLAFLEKERIQANDSLAGAEEALRTFSEKHGVVQIDTQTRGMLEYVARLRAEIDSKEVQLQVLRQQSTPFNSDVIRAETELKALKEKLQCVENPQNQANIGNVCLATSKVPVLSLEYMRLYREAKFQEVRYQLFSKMVELARMDMVRKVTVIQIIDQAKLPETKANRRLLPALLVGIFTFFLMILVAFTREHWQKALQSEDQALRWMQLHRYTQKWREDIDYLLSCWKRKN